MNIQRSIDLSRWSLEEKIGQLFICGFHSLVPDQGIVTLIRDYHVGGIVYFRRNIQSVEQLATLSQDLQSVSRSHPEVPLFISIDQEGGMVARLDHEGLSRIPGNMTLGAAFDPGLTEEAAVLAAQEMKMLGINLNFAPCVDINNNPANPVIGVRSFGENPQLVAEHGAAAIQGYQKSGIAATAKHFPGHGDTAVDSHLGLAVVPHGVERLTQVELVPFKRAIEEDVDCIMTAHVIFPAFEQDDIPATISKKVLKDLLRHEMNYQGVIITDCLEMHAISQSVGVSEGAVRALEAGADIVLVSHTLEEQTAAIKAVCEAVQSGRLSEERINESVSRVFRLKDKRISYTQAVEPLPIPLIREEVSGELIRRITERSITLVRDQGNIPLQAGKPILVIWPELRHRTEVDEPSVHTYTLKDALQNYFDHVSEYVLGSHPTTSEISEAIKLSMNFEQVVVITYTSEGSTPSGQIELVEALYRIHGDEIVVASTRNPYDINHFHQIGTYICLYENRPYSLDALAKVLAGKMKPTGRLPVSLNPENRAEN
ncbi:putative lipoprotein YbbD precursor [compost metagenome]